MLVFEGGTFISDKTKALISKAWTGTVLSEETRRKMSVAKGTARALKTYSKKIWRLVDTGKLLDDRYLISTVK